MQIVIEPADSSIEQVNRLEDEVYTPAVMATVSWRDVTFASADWRVLIRDETRQLLSHVGIHLRDALLNDRPVRIGGIGSVMTKPNFRCQGLANAGILRAQSFLTEQGTYFNLLFCDPNITAFYANLGWHPFVGDVIVEQPKGRGLFTAGKAMVLGLQKSASTDGILDLCGPPW